MDIGRTTIKLSATEQQALRAAVQKDTPEFEHRLANVAALEIDRYDQPFFRRHLILEISSAMPFPARSITVAAWDDGMHVLTAHIEHLQAVAAHDPPLDLDDETRAAGYARHGQGWTSEYALGELRIGTFSDIPWNASLAPADEQVIDALASRIGRSITGEQHQRVDEGWSFRSWWLAHRRLIERELVVPRDGKLRRSDTIHAQDLPVPAGNHWRFVNGRYIPVG
jgi:nitrate/nitrite-specific signal transduction histidine kinase